jgi:hypothetical protein
MKSLTRRKKATLPGAAQFLMSRLECAVQSGTRTQHRWPEFVPDKSFPRLVFGRRPETNEEKPP